MRFLSTAFALLVALTFTTRTFAVEDTWDVSVQVSATVQSSPARITLAWPQDTNGVPSAYTVYRRAPGSTSWGSGTNIPGSSTSYVDSSVSAGTAYEYRIVKAAGGYTGYGYILAGVEAPLVDSRGKVVLVVDNSVAGSLATELAQLDQDLRGDGWTVIRRDVGRNDSPASVKAVIKSVYDSDRANVKSVFLFGHVPVAYSGQLNPDGHPDHVGAWPADAYYGDMDGNWTDNSVNYTQTINGDPADAARLTNRPGDGKFDQTNLPSSVELEVGRVDLANMPVRLTWGGPATAPSETELLRKYLNKDHNFRHRRVNPPRRAILGDYFGYRGGEAFAGSGFRSFAPLVGANNIRNLNIEFNDQRGVWIPQAAANDNLLAYACGAGAYDSMSGLGNRLYNGATTPDLVQANVRGVFNLLFGSWLGDWDHEDNFLRAPLMTDYGLTAAWSGRPHWYMHTMGLGNTVGSTARLTQNNNGDYQTVINSGQNQIHVALMGDPTLRLHPVAPVSNLNGTTSGSSVSLSWTASNDSNLAGYHVYRAAAANGSYTRLTSSPITATNYTDNNATSGATYMVRAIKLETGASGSYFNGSQGLFWTVGGNNNGGSTTPPPTTTPSDTSAPSVSISAPGTNATVSGASVTVQASANDNVGVTAVQFKLDGANLGSEDASAPFTATWDTTSASNGTHTLTAVARDAAGNIASATAVTVTVSNTTGGGNTGGGSNGGTTTPPTETTPPTAPAPAAGTVVWFDDALPTGAGASGAWNWTTSPAPFSGTKSHQTALSGGLHEYSFNWATPLTIKTGEILFAYVYIDPSSPPSEVMFSFVSDNWEHRAYWGANTIQYGTNGTASRRPMSAMPTAGQWVRLEIPASQIGLEGQTVAGFGLSVQGGRMSLDYVGKYDPSVATTTPPPTTPTTPPSTTTPTAVVWFEDALPAGAGSSGTWNWVTSSPAPFAGTKAHQLPAAAGLHEASFNWATPFSIATGDSLVTHVYIDPANPPTSIMLSWVSDNWEHRAYWGADQISYGTPNTNGHRSMGPIPAAGQWVTLTVPASAVGLEGQSVAGMGFSLFGGKATFDSTGKAPAGSTTTTPPSTDSGSTTTPPPTTTTNPPTPTDPNIPTAPQLPAATDVVWFDDALPAGASGSGTGGDGWNWVTSNPTPKFGTKAHQTNAKNGLHEHSFNWGQTLNIVTGDTLYTYVYIDPANKPAEIMLSWVSDNWEHRAYWGDDKIGYGNKNSASRYYVGPVPTAGQWVRLEVPAKAVGLEGASVTGMGFSLYDGRVTWDKTGKMTAGSTSGDGTTTTPPTTPPTSPAPPTATETVWFDDAIPAGAAGGATGGDAWNWITTNPAPFSGTKATQTTINSALHEISFNWAGSPLAPATGEAVFGYVYIDPANIPQEIMVSWYDGNWEHRAYWGADKIGYGSNGTAGRYYAGPMPAAGKWVRLEVPAKSVGLEGSKVVGLGLSLYGGRVAWDKFGKASTSTTTGGGTSGGTGGTPTDGTTSGGGTTTPPVVVTPPVITPPPTTTPTDPTPTVPISLAENDAIRLPQVGDRQLRVLTPTLLELQRITTKAKDPAPATEWNFVDGSGNFNAPATSQFTVTVNGSTVQVQSVGFRRRVAYAPVNVRDLRIDNCLYLQLATQIPDGATVEVRNPGNALWPANMTFVTKTDPLRYSPAIHVNQEGYVPNLTKKAMVGYYIGNKGELDVNGAAGFKLVSAATGTTVYTGTLTSRKDVGFTYAPTPYQKVLQADFSDFKAPGEYQLVVPGLGASLPFLINDGVAMSFLRTYALGLYHQRSGTTNAMPYTRFVHDADHVAPAEVPSPQSSYGFTWTTIASKNTDAKTNPRHTAPRLDNEGAQLYPFVNKGKVDVSGGHFDAGDWSKYTINVGQLVHELLLTADVVQGQSKFDNLGLPESGDGISDILQEAKREADYLAKLQDADGGFYFIVYPKTREYEGGNPSPGDQQVVWPKNTSATATGVAALAEMASSPTFKAAYPTEAAAYLAKAKAGWNFLTAAINKYGKDGSYQKVTFYGDRWMHDDELAWAAAAMFLATGEAQYHQKLKEWFPNPADGNTWRDGWFRLSEGWGNAIRDYAFAARTGRIQASQLDATYLAACENQIKLAGADALKRSNASAYGTAFPDESKSYFAAGWYFSMDMASDMATAYQLDPKPEYIDALTGNMNYEGGSNPVNVTLLAGLGLKRQREMVNQYAQGDRRVLPPSGIPAGAFASAWSYLENYGSSAGNELLKLSFPSDEVSAPMKYPMYDRWADAFNVTAEFITVQQARAVRGLALLAAQTAARDGAWKPSANATINVPSATVEVGAPLTLTLGSGLNVTGARIVWEGRDQEPDFGSTFVFTPKNPGAQWVEVEITWPDGRRVFGAGTFNANASLITFVDDALPAGAQPGSLGGDGWNWVSSPAPKSGTVAHQTPASAGLREHSFTGAWSALTVGTGDKMFAWVYLDPAAMPEEIMLHWNDGSSWDHRAYWGANKIGYGTEGSNGRRNMGALPAGGGWVKLEVPASSVGLEGRDVTGMCFSAFGGGKVLWDAAGRTSPSN